MGSGSRGAGSDDCGRIPCQVGAASGRRTRARTVRDWRAKGHRRSALFNEGRPDLDTAQRFADAVGVEHVGAPSTEPGGRGTHGWKTSTGTTAADAVRELEPYCGEFLYTHVDTEGLMKGTDITAIRVVRDATKRPLIAAGGVTTQAEIDQLDALGIDAVVGMAIYTGTLQLTTKTPRHEQ